MNNNLIIKSLEGTNFDTIYESYLKAFADYDAPIHSPEKLNQLITRRGFKAELSFGAFNGGEIVSFTNNGIGMWNGKQTAYDTGTGTVKDYRGQGLAKRIFIESEEVLKSAGIEQYLLEVMQHNEKAVKLYKGVGFEITREFEYFYSELEKINLPELKPYTEIEIRTIETPKESDVEKFWDFKPAWQNDLDCVNRRPELFETLGAFKNGEFIGYIIAQLNSGDITQIGVHKDYRRQRIASNLLNMMIKKLSSNTIQIINTEKGIESIKAFIDFIELPKEGEQYEMIKKI